MKRPTPSSAPHAQLVWYIQAAERVWGPYPQARLANFVVDKRLTADSLIATHPAGPFGPARRRPELQRLFEPFATSVEAAPAPLTVEPPALVQTKPAVQARGQLSPEPDPEPKPAPAAETPAHPRPSSFSRKPQQKEIAAKAALPARAVVVWAELTSVSATTFEVTLASHGPFVGVRPGVWLIRAQTEAATLRNTLSRMLTREDALLVIEAPLERAAWFNLDHEAESNLRQLWGSAGVANLDHS